MATIVDSFTTSGAAHRDRIQSSRYLHGPVACLAAGLVALVSTLLSGCIPAVWLPDSSGFVFTRAKNFTTLEFCAVPSGECRTLAAVTAHTMWPAVSPDGARIALARITPTDDRTSMTCQLLFYDMNGQVVDRSDTYPWRKPQPIRDREPAPGAKAEPSDDAHAFNESENGAVPFTAVFWDKSSGKLIVHEVTPMTEDSPKGQVGLYDQATRKLTTFVGNACPIGGTPCRPDGKGILVTRGNPKQRSLALYAIEWDGTEHRIELPTDATRDPEIATVVYWPWTASSQWVNGNATITFGKHRIIIDLASNKATLEVRPDEIASANGVAIAQFHTFGEHGTKVRVLSGNTRALEILPPDSKDWKRLLETSDPLLLCPSPDGKWLWVRITTDAMEATSNPNILLIDAKGEVTNVGVKRSDPTKASPRP
jgi:hypothetical protein